MASFKKQPAHKFSRVKNDLAELQRWWPIHIKDDGVLGISCDPVLFRTNFGSDTVSSDDESVQAGIRVEAINDDGTDVSGTEPTITIANSGTLNATCTINHADGTKTPIRLVAPTNCKGTGAGQDVMPFVDINGDTLTGNVSNFNANGGHKDHRGGPYPIFMTIQELAETIDTYRHIGAANDAQKLAFVPQKMFDTVHSSPATFVQNPIINNDPRHPVDATNNALLPQPSPYRATVFMPMMLDNNQFSKDISGAQTLWGGQQWHKNGITRYDSDPEGADSATIIYKKVGDSGDHLLGYNRATASDIGNTHAPTVTQILEAKWTSQDSSDCPPPKYRMSMALAAFLKDGTYSLNNGVIIPYVYDASRTVGGKNTDTLYMTWNGESGIAETGSEDLSDLTPASIYPYFDFVQGPIAPRAQGSNWTNAVLADHTRTNKPLRFEVPPNTRKNVIDTIAVVETVHNTPPAGAGTQGQRLMTIDVNTPSSTGTEPHGATLFEVGDAVYLSGITGVLGSGTAMTIESENIWGSRFDNRRSPTNNGSRGGDTVGGMDCNGWWIVSKVETDTPTANHVRYSFNVRNLKVTAAYGVSATARLQGGRMGGPEIGFNTTFYATGSTASDVAETEYLEDMGLVGKLNNPHALNPYQLITDFTPTPTTTDHGRNVAAAFTIGTGFQCGMNQGDNNVPPASSSNDTYPARITLGEAAQISETGEFIGDRPVPRSISIQTLGVAPAQNMPSSQPIVSNGNGSLRLPAPLGHDLCLRYNGVGKSGRIPQSDQDIATNMESTLWRVRQDITEGFAQNEGPQGGPNRWAWRGVSTPLWSYIDGNTGRHAWDYIKPPTWTYGRNRCWPAHERLGTRLSMSPSLFPNSIGWSSPSSGNFVAHSQETTKIGLSEIGCSPIFLDMQMTAFIPKKDNRLSIIEFDMNDADDILGRHHMIYGTTIRDTGFGFKPLWNGTGVTGQYYENTFEQKDGTEVPITNKGVLFSSTLKPFIIGAGGSNPTTTPVSAGFGASWASFSINSSQALLDAASSPLPNNGQTPPYPSNFIANRPAVWFTGGLSHWAAPKWQNSETFTLPSNAGFGRMGTGFGQGPSFSYDEGINTVRAIFTAGGMTCVFNGETIGTDNSALEPVWGFQIKACNVFGFANREPLWIGDTTPFSNFINSINVVYSQFTGIEEEEASVVIQVDDDIYADFDSSGTPIDTVRGSTTKAYFLESTDGTWAGASDFYPNLPSMSPRLQQDTGGRFTRADNPAFQTSLVDLQVDEIILRQIPTPAMLPFTVDTLTQQATAVASGLARYTSLLIEADNIDVSAGMKVTVTLLEPPAGSGIAKEASTIITGFENLDPDFLGGVGEVDLTGLPQTALDNGFVIRFNFFVPSSEQPSLHPINWNETPIIRNYQVFFDHKPTADNTIIGNTFNGSVASTVGQTTIQTFTTKVGHIVSMRLAGNTTDPDRKITHLKVDLGDGTITDFMPVETPAASVTLDISHVYSSRPAGGTFDIKVFAKDDSDNESDFVLTPNKFIRVTITAAEPVAVLRAVPSMVRAGQAIRFDGSDSYAIDTGATLTDYAFTFGDGSTGVNGTAVFQDHTYAQAGEFMATLIVTDSTGSVSPVAKALVKVLPATLVVPLTLSTKPSSFSRTRTSALTSTPILDAVYPEVTDMGQRNDEFVLTGMFLKDTQETDIAFMEELLLSGALVEFEYQEVNFTGTPDSKTFVGRMISFDYNREGGNIDRTPYTATFVREAGLGA